jgi:hypothetical protein
VATQDVFSEEEQAQLRGFPEINRAELVRHFTLSSSPASSAMTRPVAVSAGTVTSCAASAAATAARTLAAIQASGL